MIYKIPSKNTISEIRINKIISNRKVLGISWPDISVLLYLIHLSRRRIIIQKTTRQIAIELGINEIVTYKLIQNLRELDYIRKTDYKKVSAFIVDPLLINNGDFKRQSFKIKLWENAIQAKRKRVAIHD